jgi:hypothetical protein
MAQKVVATGIQQQLQVTLIALPQFSTTVYVTLFFPTPPQTIPRKTKSAFGTPYTDAIHAKFVTISKKSTFHAIN